MKLLQWLVKVIVSLAALLAAIDQLGNGFIKSFLAKQGSIEELLFLVISYYVAPSALVGFIIYFFFRRGAWKKWCRCFEYAGSAKAVPLNKLRPQRRMDLPYVHIQRSLTHPATLGKPLSSEPRIAADAEQYFLNQIDNQNWHQTHCGFLLEGTALVGKTRFAGEWLRLHRGRSLLLVPSYSSVPQPYKGLKRYRKRGISIFLDDLDNYKATVGEICRFVDVLHRWGIPTLIVATVRDSGPGQLVQTDPGFRCLLERLEHLALGVLTNAQMELLGEELGEDICTGPKDRSPTFEWLLGEQFRVMRQRYATELSNRERAFLRAARLLDSCGIPLIKDRWAFVAQELFQVPAEISVQADLYNSLRLHGFLFEESPEPSYLKHVVNGDLELDPLLQKFESVLEKHKDGEAFLCWGIFLFIQRLDLNRSAAYFKLAVSMQEMIGTAEALRIAALASGWVGAILHDEAGDAEGARQAYEEAVALGKRSGTAEALRIAALAGHSLGAILHETGDAEGATQAWEEAVALGKRSGAEEALRIAALASGALAVILHETGDAEGATQAWEEAVALGKRSGTAEALRIAALAGHSLGAILHETGDAERARQAYEEAVALGKRSGTVEGLEGAALASGALAVILHEAGDAEGARQAYEEAIGLGKRSGTAKALETASQASHSLGAILHETGDAEGARRGRRMRRPSRWESEAIPRRGSGLLA